ncbi:LysR family transcriptional regulator [Sphingobium aquiterrae]|uniref:LysR family transcriptional regulator n=1 Tax=Sphingobium aquiterrae TaxID=2038656 RepID=UPI003019B06D
MAPLVEGMRWFVRVAECGSFSAVAREAMTNQVTVGRRISMLEAHFRMTLLRRSTRTLTLTDEGRIFLEHARRILREVDALEAEVHGGGRAPVGHVRIGVTSTFGCHLARQLPAFHRAYPGVTIEMQLSDGFVNMVEDGLDLAMRTGQVSETTVIAKHLGDVPRYLVAAPAYLAEHALPGCGADLQQHDCVLFSYGATSQIWSVDGEPVRVSGTYRTNSSLAQHEAVRMGMGISLFAYFQVEEDVRAGRLTRLLPDARLDPIPFYVTRPANQTLAPRVRLVRDWIVREARGLIGNAPGP